MFDRAKLKKHLERYGLSVSQFARDIGVTESAVRQILTGVRQPSLTMAAQIAGLMECTIDDLVINED